MEGEPPIVFLTVDGSVDELVEFWRRSLSSAGFDVGNPSTTMPRDVLVTVMSFSSEELDAELTVTNAKEPFQACSNVSLTYDDRRR